ncbi:hypothetical protein NEIRO02_1700 [Nematocida sp. AWRm79]|nr:hypothetical protein NEIRO02_1700 [Nematocida sp. AWRm79]
MPYPITSSSDGSLDNLTLETIINYFILPPESNNHSNQLLAPT